MNSVLSRSSPSGKFNVYLTTSFFLCRFEGFLTWIECMLNGTGSPTEDTDILESSIMGMGDPLSMVSMSPGASDPASNANAPGPNKSDIVKTALRSLRVHLFFIIGLPRLDTILMISSSWTGY
jgi:hypothetical protein